MDDKELSQNQEKVMNSLPENALDTENSAQNQALSAKKSQSEVIDDSVQGDIIRKSVEENKENLNILEARPHTESVQEGQDSTELEEFEETYEEEIEEDGELKVVVKTRIVTRKKIDPKMEEENLEEQEIEEEYEEEDIDENGEAKVVVKKRLVKVLKKLPSKDGTKQSFTEVEEEFEEEEVDESGQTIVVKKIRLIKVPRKKSSKGMVSKTESIDSYEEIDEEYEEEETQENGETLVVKKKRTVKVLKPKHKVSHKTLEKSDSKEKDSGEKLVRGSIQEESILEEVVLKDEEIEEEEIEEEEEMGVEEEEVGVEEEEVAEGEKVAVKEKKRGRRKKKSKKDKSLSEEEEIESVITKKKRKRRKRKSKEDSQSKSEKSFDVSQEGEEVEEEESLGGIDEEEEIEEISLTSSQIRLAEEQTAIAAQFEILQRLRSEHVALKKKNFQLTNKLVQYFKKQKMDHVFTESKEDPELDQRYLKKITQFYESNQAINDEKQKINTEWETQLAINEDLNLKVKEGWEGLMSHKRDVSAKIIDPKTGRTIINDKTIEDLLTRQENQLKQMSDCRLMQIKLRRRIEGKKRERQMDHMGMDFNLMDFEKLSSLKEYYTDKITERDVEVAEINQKMAAMEDKLGHVKEQLRKREEEMVVEQNRLQRLSFDLEKKRINLNVVKATKHKTEKKTIKIKQQSGLLAYPSLLKDFEEKTHQLRLLTSETDALKRTYKQGMKRIEKLRDTIRRKTLHKYTCIGSSCASNLM